VLGSLLSSQKRQRPLNKGAWVWEGVEHLLIVAAEHQWSMLWDNCL
jgi:hypothetical protein